MNMKDLNNNDIEFECPECKSRNIGVTGNISLGTSDLVCKDCGFKEPKVKVKTK